MDEAPEIWRVAYRSLEDFRLYGVSILTPKMFRVNCIESMNSEDPIVICFLRNRGRLPFYEVNTTDTKARHKQYKKNYRLIFLMNITINVLNKPSNI